MKEAISEIAVKQRQAIFNWELKNPEWAKTEKGKDEYLRLVKSVMSDVSERKHEQQQRDDE